MTATSPCHLDVLIKVTSLSFPINPTLLRRPWFLVFHNRGSEAISCDSPFCYNSTVSSHSVNEMTKQIGRTCATCIYLGWVDPTSSGDLEEVTRIQRQKIREWSKNAAALNSLACRKGRKSSEEIKSAKSIAGCPGWKAYSGGIGPQLALQQDRDGLKLRRVLAAVVVAVSALAVALFLFLR